MIVGLGGYALSGKDAFADAMVAADPRWHKTYMSHALEQALLVLDPWIPRDVAVFSYENDGRLLLSSHIRYSELHAEVGYTESKKNPEVRRLLQMLGTEVGRNMFGENVWIDKMAEIANQHELCLVTGIRYHNEMQFIRDQGGVSVWISRPGVNAINTHSSDNTVVPFDFDIAIDNNGSLEDLSLKARQFSLFYSNPNFKD